MWTMSEATDFLASIHDDLSAIGCDVGIYGSVARGRLGNDLDLVAWAPDGGTVDATRVLDVFERHGCYQHDAPYGGGPELYLQLMRGGQKIHVRMLMHAHAPSGTGLGATRVIRGPRQSLIHRDP